MADPAHVETDKLIADIEKGINSVYRNAQKALQAKYDDYFRRYRKKDQIKREMLAAGLITADQYADWRKNQLMMGKRWEKMKDQIAHDMHDTNVMARNVTQKALPEIYANNFNYGIYEAEVGGGVDISFTLYNREAVENILRENPRLLPMPGKELTKRIAEGKDVLWNKQQLQSVILQGILQGESIPKLAQRLRVTVSDSNRKASIRNARTMATTAQNAGRMDSYKRAESKGLKLKKTWVATLDERTRHWHRQLDGVTIGLDEKFKTPYGELLNPGDRNGAPADLYNCRCTMIGQIKGFERDVTTSRLVGAFNGNGERMTYDEWKKAKAKSQDILSQEKKGNVIRGAWNKRYKQAAEEAQRRMNGE